MLVRSTLRQAQGERTVLNYSLLDTCSQKVIIFLLTGRGENFYIEASSQRTKTKHQVGGKTMLRKLIGFFKEEDGATAVEYALFVALIAAIIVIAVQAIGNKANTAFNKVENAMP